MGGRGNLHLQNGNLANYKTEKINIICLPKIEDHEELQNVGGIQKGQIDYKDNLNQLNHNNHCKVGKWTNYCFGNTSSS